MASLKGDSPIAGTPGVLGENTGGGTGVAGHSDHGRAVEGRSDTNFGVTGDSRTFAGVRGTSVDGRGTEGWSKSNAGVFGISETGDGVFGTGRRGVVGDSETFQGVFGRSTKNAGVVGESREFHAVFGISHDPNNGGVFGTNDRGGWGVIGRSDSNAGVSGESVTGRGVHGISQTGEGVHGQTHSLTVAAVAGISHAPAGRGAAIYGEKRGDSGHAGYFVGHVHVTRDLTVDGDIVLTGAADCAEDFDVADADHSAPGTVMVLDEEGVLRPSRTAYDTRVVGVVSGAGDYRPGIVLDKRPSDRARRPIALLGKVFCRVDASAAPVRVGDLLTTSDVSGHAMRAVDPAAAFGAVIGKALRSLSDGRGLIPILVTLQ